MRNMKTWRARFNTYFLVGLVGLLGGCKTTEEKKKSKEKTLMTFYREINADESGRTMDVTVVRAQPQLVTVDRTPFLDSGSVEKAAVVPTLGGFVIRLQFDRHGAWILQNISTSFRGSRIAIHAQFGDARWLGAPVINRNISDGVLTFTPDATMEEAERIARGLNNVAAALKKKN